MRGDVLEGRDHLDALGHQLRNQLRARALPDAYGPDGGVAESGGEGHAHRDHDLARRERCADRLHGLRRVLEGHRQDHDSGLLGGFGVAAALDLRARDRRADAPGRLLRPLGLARADHDLRPGARKAQREAEPLIARPAEDRDRRSAARAEGSMEAQIAPA
jgi:hypothetical protein